MLDVYLAQGFTGATKKTYRSVLSKFSQYLEKNGLSIEAVTPEVVYRYTKKYKDTTQNKVVSVIKTYYKWVTKLDLAVEGVTPNSFRADRQLDIHEVRKMMKVARPRDRLIMRFLFITGVRVAEAARLKKSDIVKEQGRYWLEYVAKGNKIRRIRLQNFLAQDLLKFDSGEEALFGISSRQIERIVSKLGEEALGRVVTPHMFRHGFATELMRQGVAFQKIQEELGHENISTTLKYLHNKRDNENWYIDL
jgi:integrase/recombinase XerD